MSNVINNYTENSISAYEGPETLRRRPQTMLGSADIHGAIHTVTEIIANATDEFSAGFGNEIDLIIYEDNSVKVVDRGRGVPMAWNEESQKYNWELVYNTLYASGKAKEGAAYNDSEGLNGCGCTATQYTSDFMHVTSVREVQDEKGNGTGEYHRYTMNFENGYPVGELLDEKLEGKVPTGTTVHYRPSASVFNGEIEIPMEEFVGRLGLKAISYAGLKFNYTYKGSNTMVFYYPGGMREFLEKTVSKPVSKYPISVQAIDTNCNDTKEKLATRNYTATIECHLMFAPSLSVQSTFHNGAQLKGGPTHEAVLKAVAKAISSHAIAIGKLGKKDKFNVSDISNIVNFVCQSKCNADFSLYMHQTKSELNNPSIVKLISNAVDAQVVKWLSENTSEANNVVTFALANRTAREHADKVRKQAIKQLTADIRKVGKAPEGFIDCATKDSSVAELYIIEGESAKGGAVFARDKSVQAIQPLRGKIANCLKKPIDVLLSDESLILQLLSVFGCGVELKSKAIKDLPQFDESKLRFNKIILAADADVDGGHIIVLCIVMIWFMCPSLLRNGHVYTVKTPLYKISYGGRTEYYYDDESKNRQVEQFRKHGIKPGQFKIQRFKGLGEMSAKDLRDTVMDRNKRQLQRLTCPESEEELAKILSTLMGKDIHERRELIAKNFSSVDAIRE